MKKNCSKPISLRPRKSPFIELFRTTPPKTVCPNFHVLAHANGCAFSPQCSYCYLKSSFWCLDESVAFSNTDAMIAQIRKWISKDNLESYMLNAGNLSDSLAFEGIRPIIPDLVETFRQYARNRPHCLLILTKGGTRECASLLKIKPCENVIVSFSVNNYAAAARMESGAATVQERLKAASDLKKRGWRLRIRIDPMILGYDYRQVSTRVRKLNPESVTLGTLRAEKSLPKFAGSGIFKDLEKPDDDFSMARYPFEKRYNLYRQAVDIIGNTCPMALCEETPEMWDALNLDRNSKPCNCNAAVGTKTGG